MFSVRTYQVDINKLGHILDNNWHKSKSRFSKHSDETAYWLDSACTGENHRGGSPPGGNDG